MSIGELPGAKQGRQLMELAYLLRISVESVPVDRVGENPSPQAALAREIDTALERPYGVKLLGCRDFADGCLFQLWDTTLTSNQEMLYTALRRMPMRRPGSRYDMRTSPNYHAMLVLSRSALLNSIPALTEFKKTKAQRPSSPVKEVGLSHEYLYTFLNSVLEPSPDTTTWSFHRGPLELEEMYHPSAKVT